MIHRVFTTGPALNLRRVHAWRVVQADSARISTANRAAWKDRDPAWDQTNVFVSVVTRDQTAVNVIKYYYSSKISMVFHTDEEIKTIMIVYFEL